MFGIYKLKNLFVLLFVLSFTSIASASIVAVGWEGPVHYHGGGYGPGPGPYYGGGGGGFFFGGGWAGPNVIINVPVERPRYYVRNCENMEVCDEYGQCWLERYCD